MEDGVLQITHERMARCPYHAAEAQEVARNAVHPKTRRGSLPSEKGWIHLNASRELTARLGCFCVSRRTSLAEVVPVHTPRFDREHVNAGQARNALIAIVDDDQWAREGMNSFVGSLGYLGATFTSAEDYLGSHLKQRAGCLILDVHLCGMSGPDLQARLLAEGYCTPIIFVSAHFEDHVRARVMAAGAFGYFAKPCDERALIKCLERAVGG